MADLDERQQAERQQDERQQNPNQSRGSSSIGQNNSNGSMAAATNEPQYKDEPLWFPLPAKKGKWRKKETDRRARAETTKHIDRLIKSGEANASQNLPIEYRNRLSEVVTRLEECLYRNSPSLEYYKDGSTLCQRLRRLFAQIAKQHNERDRIERLMQDFEERNGFKLSTKLREYYRNAVTHGVLIDFELEWILKLSEAGIALMCDMLINACSNSIKLNGRTIDGTETDGASRMVADALAAKTNLKRLVFIDCCNSMVSNAITAATSGGRSLDLLQLTKCEGACVSAMKGSMANVKRLVIEDVPVDISVAKSLSEGMKDSNVLSTLRIDKGFLLSDAAAAELAKGLKANTSLKVMTLRFASDATERGIKSISEALSQNRTLTKLYLCGHVNVDGARAIQNMLAQNTTLRSLDFDTKCGVSFACIKALASGLAQTSTLKRLALFGLKIGPGGTEEFTNAMMKNYSCVDLHVGQNGKVSSVAFKKIARLTEINKICSNREEAIRQKAAEFGPIDTRNALPTSRTTVDTNVSPSTSSSATNTAAAAAAAASAVTAEPSNTGRTFAVDPKAASDTSQAAIITPTNAAGTTKEADFTTKSNSEDDANTSRDRSLTAASNSDKGVPEAEPTCKPEPEPWFDAMLSKIPADVLLQHIRKRKIPDDVLLQHIRTCKRKITCVDLSTGEDVVQQPDGSGKALQNLISQNEKHAAKLVKVKKEKADAEESLVKAKEDLAEKNEDIEDANELAQQQTLFIDRLQSKNDDALTLAEKAGADTQKINEIRYRP